MWHFCWSATWRFKKIPVAWANPNRWNSSQKVALCHQMAFHYLAIVLCHQHQLPMRRAALLLLITPLGHNVMHSRFVCALLLPKLWLWFWVLLWLTIYLNYYPPLLVLLLFFNFVFCQLEEKNTACPKVSKTFKSAPMRRLAKFCIHWITFMAKIDVSVCWSLSLVSF